jgi:hypothetical protein
MFWGASPASGHLVTFRELAQSFTGVAGLFVDDDDDGDASQQTADW